MPTTPHAATAYPEEDLYIKSPAETRDLFLAEIEEMRAAHARENRTVVEQYEKLTGQYVAYATGVTGTGSQKTFTGGAVPPDLAALNKLGALGETAAWAPGNAVRLGDKSWAKWDGTKWVVALPTAWAGHTFTDFPGVTSATTPPASTGPDRLVANPTTAWTAGQQITVNGFPFTWSGSAWVVPTP
jgi:hypothetical protein